MLLNCGVEDSWESLGLQDQTSQSWRKSVLNIHWKDWCWSWNSNTLTTWCEELTHWKRPWCWERLKAGGEGNERGWDGWMASPTQWAWVRQAPGVGDGWGRMACCSPWGGKESDMTERLNWTGKDVHCISYKKLTTPAAQSMRNLRHPELSLFSNIFSLQTIPSNFLLFLYEATLLSFCYWVCLWLLL